MTEWRVFFSLYLSPNVRHLPLKEQNSWRLWDIFWKFHPTHSHKLRWCRNIAINGEKLLTKRIAQLWQTARNKSHELRAAVYSRRQGPAQSKGGKADMDLPASLTENLPESVADSFQFKHISRQATDALQKGGWFIDFRSQHSAALPGMNYNTFHIPEDISILNFR